MLTTLDFPALVAVPEDFAVINDTSLTVTIFEHPQGCTLCIEHDSGSLVLDRDGAFDLHEKLSAKLGAMPSKAQPPILALDAGHCSVQ